MHIHAQEESGADREVDLKLSGSDVKFDHKFDHKFYRVMLGTIRAKLTLSEGRIGPSWVKLALSGLSYHYPRVELDQIGLSWHYRRVDLGQI